MWLSPEVCYFDPIDDLIEKQCCQTNHWPQRQDGYYETSYHLHSGYICFRFEVVKLPAFQFVVEFMLSHLIVLVQLPSAYCPTPTKPRHDREQIQSIE